MKTRDRTLGTMAGSANAGWWTLTLLHMIIILQRILSSKFLQNNSEDSVLYYWSQALPSRISMPLTLGLLTAVWHSCTKKNVEKQNSVVKQVKGLQTLYCLEELHQYTVYSHRKRMLGSNFRYTTNDRKENPMSSRWCVCVSSTSHITQFEELKPGKFVKNMD